MLFQIILFFCRAEALQSVVQLLGEKELYDYYSDQYKVHSINWSQDKAKKILEAWQRKFTRVKTIFAWLLELANVKLFYDQPMADWYWACLIKNMFIWFFFKLSVDCI